jgi:hypothetical protein
MPIDLDPSRIAIRAQEFHEGLRDVAAFGPKERHLRNTLTVGKAGVLASHLKGLDHVDSPEALYSLAAELGINGTELEVVLRVLQDVDFATVVGSESDFTRVELRVPELRNSYADLGEYWLQRKPGEIERASIQVLDQVVEFPCDIEVIKKDLNLADPELNILLELSRSGSLIDRFASDDGSELLYSPLTVEESPQALMTLSQRFPQRQVVRAMELVRARQGDPADHLVATIGDVVGEGVRLGAFCPVKIITDGREHTFLFTPRGALSKEEYVILDKARAILACVRCGEHFANLRKVFDPAAIIRTLRRQKTFKYPRPDVPQQYGLLVKKGIAAISPDRQRSGFFHLHFLDTPENMKSLRVAEELLQTGDVSRTAITVNAADFLIAPGSYAGALTSRAKMMRMPAVSSEVEMDIVMEISKLARGVLPR